MHNERNDTESGSRCLGSDEQRFAMWEHSDLLITYQVSTVICHDTQKEGSFRSTVNAATPLVSPGHADGHAAPGYSGVVLFSQAAGAESTRADLSMWSQEVVQFSLQSLFLYQKSPKRVR